jgi:hypothetical protein
VFEHPRAYVDESLRLPARLYLMAAVLVPDDRAEAHRTALRGLLQKHHRRLHWRDENDRRRAEIATAIAGLRPRGLVVVGEGLDPSHQERARRKCMERLLWELEQRRVAEAVFESRSRDMDRRDREMVARLRGRRVTSARLPVVWESPDVEPLLWLPDVIAGAASLVEAGVQAYWKDLGADVAIDKFDIHRA